ncbi:MAG: hypothetical protein ACRCT8_08980 [Lacipirellulaceae bacterium]
MPKRRPKKRPRSSRLATVPLDPPVRPLAQRVQALLDDADERIERFVFDHRDNPVPAFVPCDFVSVHYAIERIVELNLAPGNRFVEWGSGLGVVTCLAGFAGFDAIGIEIEPELVEASIELAADHGAEAEFVCGSFVPVGADDVLERHASSLARNVTWLRSDGDDAYDELGLDPDDFDFVFAYPWPGEEGVVFDLFAEYASVGALLLTHHGEEDLRLRRKVR